MLWSGVSQPTCPKIPFNRNCHFHKDHGSLCRADNNHVSLLVLLDLSAAFDTADHDILLDVLLRRFKISDTTFSWFQSYLSGRTQTVVYNEQQTDIIDIDCSVPWGSVLRPVKCAAYTEDIVDVVDRRPMQLHLDADDTQLNDRCRLDDVSRVRSQTSSCVADVSQWCESRRLQLNTDKTEVIWFGSRANLNKLHSQEHHIQIG